MTEKIPLTVDLNYVRELEEDVCKLNDSLKKLHVEWDKRTIEFEHETYSLERELKYAKLFLSSLITEGKLDIGTTLDLSHWKNPKMDSEVIPRALDLCFENDGFGYITLKSKRFLDWYNYDGK